MIKDAQTVDLDKKPTQKDTQKDPEPKKEEVKEEPATESDDIVWDLEQVKEIPNTITEMKTELNTFKTDVLKEMKEMKEIIKSIPAPKIRIQNITEKKKPLTEMDLFKGRIDSIFKNINN